MVIYCHLKLQIYLEQISLQFNKNNYLLINTFVRKQKFSIHLDLILLIKTIHKNQRTNLSAFRRSDTVESL